MKSIVISAKVITLKKVQIETQRTERLTENLIHTTNWKKG